MHFSKTYTQLLQSLPPEMRDNAIEYRQLKKIINQIVSELSELGLQPAVLHELMVPGSPPPVTPPAAAGAVAEVPHPPTTEGSSPPHSPTEESSHSAGPSGSKTPTNESSPAESATVASASLTVPQPSTSIPIPILVPRKSDGDDKGKEKAHDGDVDEDHEHEHGHGHDTTSLLSASFPSYPSSLNASLSSSSTASSSVFSSFAAPLSGDTQYSSSSTPHPHPHSNQSHPHPHPHAHPHPRVVYELNAASGKIEPQLRIWIWVKPKVGGISEDGHGSGSESASGATTPIGHLSPSASSSTSALGQVEETGPAAVDSKEGGDEAVASPENAKESGGKETYGQGDHVEGLEELEDGVHYDDGDGRHAELLWQFQQRHFDGERIVEVDEGEQYPHDPDTHHTHHAHPDAHIQMREIVIPLVHDTHFFSLLSSKLTHISTHLASIHTSFSASLTELQRTIADAAAPASASASTRFRPSSALASDAGGVRVRTKEADLKSDLYFWREIFQMYVEAEVFESVAEADRGERSVEESERRLQMFAERATQRGMGEVGRLKLPASREALETFLRMNLMILDVKKFSHANSEATRKILKKHTKRTALFYPGLSSSSLLPASSSTALALSAHASSPFTFPRLLVQALCTTLLPIIPSLEDYSCLICTSIAFKPIRLDCGHLFCVRCLVKMQKRGKGECPCCRRWVVLGANRRNVDWALLNFMQDWFPLEARDKLHHNEKEAAEEEMRELGIDPDQGCIVM
ncbi:hypothetical protein JR316_0011473 [Psilocybe cubensis]|uniref:Uncharacterized protein n=2 Tax=Psilocybe cubensis TaxID=181762 RepID=A0A8H8CIX6_PSICU|nr:hypothetical protein JR316_0011473 [Psilocybe cubensis]KAH9475912.1 hypothetical protein JR316_0011473 [Psilocybe cubensis]